MKIAFLCPSLSRSSGGIFEIERKLAQALVRLPLTTLEVFGPSDQYALTDLPSWSPLQPRTFAYIGPSSFRFSPGLQRAFCEVDADLVHLHALWMFNSIIIRQWARHWGRPYLITANGMLERWAVQNSRWKKRVALALYERACLNRAACIQVNSEAEYQSVRMFGLRNPVCVIPNGIDLPEDISQSAGDRGEGPPWRELAPEGSNVLLYLGRLHPKKGLANLLNAWSRVKCGSPEWILAIAGWDQVGHQNELRKLASELGLLSSVFFIGPQFGEAKAACYRNCDAFVLPSFSEGLPMAVLEAWSHRKPVMMTLECNLPEGFSAGAALRIEPKTENIAAGLRQLFEMSGADRQTMGLRGENLVRHRFTWQKIAADMRSVYAWTLGGGQKPDCIVK